jgi:hypothetical protein
LINNSKELTHNPLIENHPNTNDESSEVQQSKPSEDVCDKNNQVPMEKNPLRENNKGI